MPTYDIQYLVNPTAGLMGRLTTAMNGLSTAIINNEDYIETNLVNRQHDLFDRLVADIKEAINLLDVSKRMLNRE